MEQQNTLSKKFTSNWIIWGFILIIPLLFYPHAVKSSWISNSDVHSILEFWAAITAMVAAGTILLHFFATGRRFFLIIALGFTLQGTEDLFHAIYAFNRIWPEAREGIENFVPGTYVAGRLILVTCILIGLYHEKKGTLAIDKNKEALIYNLVGFIAAALATIIVINTIALPKFILPGAIISRPVDLVAGLIYLVAIYAFIKMYQEEKHQTPFMWSMIASLILGFVTQIYMIHSQGLFDAQFDMSHITKILSYVFPIFGIAVGTLSMYRKEESVTLKLNNTLENLKNMAKEVRDAGLLLVSTSTGISSSVSQLVTGAEQTASAISETTATVEQVKQSTQVSSSKAEDIFKNASNTQEISISGGVLVNETIQGMNKIDEQSKVIAASIIELSEQSQAIGEIITTVDDMAEQSNLLAVNASIEAAKAGEQGKGFGVVAKEIKILSQQSKEATSQIRVLLNDIQKAISTAVMASEQGSKVVTSGVEQSEKAGETISVLGESIKVALEGTQFILTSSKQQFSGMGQMVTAMESIQSASSQNLKSNKELEELAIHLAEAGEKLKKVVESYGVLGENGT